MQVAFQGDRWVVLDSKREGISPGSVIVSIDGTPIDRFYLSRDTYLVASNERVRRGLLFNFGSLFEPRFKVGLLDGTSVEVVRATPGGPWAQPRPAAGLPDGVASRAIRSFGDPKFEQGAIDFIKANAQAKTIILDVRGNHGGNNAGRSAGGTRYQAIHRLERAVGHVRRPAENLWRPAGRRR